jgi:transposase-like protein
MSTFNGKAMSEDSLCPLCGAPAKRKVLKSLDGYSYACGDCGGRFEIGHGAQRRAERGELHPDIMSRVRNLISEGKIPRIELEADNNFRVLPDVTKE